MATAQDPRSSPGDVLLVGDEALTDFAAWLDGSLTSLRDMGISPGKLGEMALGRAQFGGWFTAMSEVAAKYETAVLRLQTLVGIQQDLIEALGIATLIAERGYENVEAEHVARFEQIMGELEAHYTRAQDPAPTRDMMGVTPIAH
ncbi:hypothetical protein GCM10009716_12700 [Streptomyces sodiiphilus]|uniref:Uncharacterized protein n=1 Tax=Streptomyces sodiiphilus TaxID=226217 RepID=A0ABN2NVA0_9ACTN